MFIGRENELKLLNDLYSSLSNFPGTASLPNIARA